MNRILRDGVHEGGFTGTIEALPPSCPRFRP